MGSYQAAATTVSGLVDEVKMSSAVMGSANIATAATYNGVTIPAGWYNFIYSPHRSGGINGAASGDNTSYGTLILSSMTGGNNVFKLSTNYYSTSGTVRLLTTADNINDAYTTSTTYLPVYMARDTTAGVIAMNSTSSGGGIKMAGSDANAWSFSAGNKKWKYTSTDGTVLTFGLTKVASW